MLSAAIILGACLTVRQARRLGMDRDVAINAVFYSLLLLFPGARLVYAFQYWREFSAPLQLLDPTRGGLALLGGFFGVVLGGALYLRRHRAEIGVFLDATVPALAFGTFPRPDRLLSGRVQLGTPYRFTLGCMLSSPGTRLWPAIASRGDRAGRASFLARSPHAIVRIPVWPAHAAAGPLAGPARVPRWAR